MAHLSKIDWPGNIRQLENAVYRAVVMSDSDQLGLTDFPQATAFTPPVEHDVAEPLVMQTADSPPLISGHDFPIAPQAAGNLALLKDDGEMRTLAEIENEIIRFALTHYRGQMSEVARRLKIGRSTLYRKLDDIAAADASPALDATTSEL